MAFKFFSVKVRGMEEVGFFTKVSLVCGTFLVLAFTGASIGVIFGGLITYSQWVNDPICEQPTGGYELSMNDWQLAATIMWTSMLILVCTVSCKTKSSDSDNDSSSSRRPTPPCMHAISGLICTITTTAFVMTGCILFHEPSACRDTEVGVMLWIYFFLFGLFAVFYWVSLIIFIVRGRRTVYVPIQ